MKPEHLMMGFLIFVFVFAGGTFMFADINIHYNTNLSLSNYSTFNHAGKLYNITDELRTDQLESEVEGGDDTTNSLIRGAYKMFRSLFELPTIFGNIMRDLANIFSIPPFVVEFIMAIFVISVLIMLAMLWLRLRS